MSFQALLFIALMGAQAVTAAYTLQDHCIGASFQNCFNFYSGDDPTHGFVKYVNQTDALSQGLYNVTGNNVFLNVDSKNRTPNGRPSLRLESKKLYNKGLFILDVLHMPSSTCGSWPAFWTYGTQNTWPTDGEIDIIEGIHDGTRNSMSLHTSSGCSITGTGSKGTVKTKNCYINAAGQISNVGCAIDDPSASSLGTPLNKAWGGIYAMQWTSSGIKMWFWPRDAIPYNLFGNSPEPNTWGTPTASFTGSGCDFNKHFVNHRIVFDTTFCGDSGNAVWASNPTCSKKAATCNDYVANNPSAFGDSYWRINYLKVFKE
ncbi:putative endo-1,3(4)-beta-glucanase [Bimuria novae-zelandiae CBS 107.79]|uniref:endo-1,3(4)-beta-glucanase n=1 Tax=Bimuria novae-zelandiae CBS 107.79 TaxID=1447943 RepID=A0A6A5VG42_9PLEO|nr:putative endo-1,3(4)-beta-glucanase [Bimuria novae-zelandiae CBS 107.79]